MDIVFDLNGQTYYIDTAVVTPFSSSSGLIATASTRPGYMAKREEKRKFERYPRFNLAPLILETTGRPGYHAQKFIKHLFSDTDHPLPPPPSHSHSHPRCLGCHPNHASQLHLQTTTPGGHDVTTLATASSPPYLLPTPFSSPLSLLDSRLAIFPYPRALLYGPTAPPFSRPVLIFLRSHIPHLQVCSPPATAIATRAASEIPRSTAHSVLYCCRNHTYY